MKLLEVESCRKRIIICFDIDISQLKNDLKGQPLELAPDDKTLELCWKGSKAFESVVDVRNFFKALALSFKNSKNVQFQIPPEAYLIISVSSSNISL